MGITHLSLFSGIGGLDLAAEWAGIQTVGQCEWAEYPTKVLEKHWPNVPRWKDIRTLTGDSFYERTGERTVDIISGGFPCQPFSVAGKRRGKEDDRYLWPEMVRIIKELRPTWVIGENVAGIVRMALHDILSELETCGYRTRTFLIPACAVGARHRRYRVAIVGYSEYNGLSSTEIAGGSQKTGGREQKRKKEASESSGTGGSGYSKVMADTNTERELQSTRNKQDIRNGIGVSSEIVADSKSQLEGRLSFGTEQEKPRFVGGGKYVCDTTSERLSDGSNKPMGGQGTQEPESERSMRRSAKSILGGMAHGVSAGMDRDLDFLINHYWDDEPDIPRIATGIEHRVDRLKCLGNAVVPQQFYPIFKAIANLRGKTFISG